MKRMKERETHADEFIRGLTGRKKKKKDERHARMRIILLLLLSNVSKSSKSKERKILQATSTRDEKTKRQCCPVLFSYLFIYLVLIR